MHPPKYLILVFGAVFGLGAAAWAEDPAPSAVDLQGNPIAPKKADPNAPKTMTKLGGDELLLPPNWTFTMMGDQKWIQCEYDCPNKAISVGWDFGFCQKDPDCAGMVAKFQKEAAEFKQAEAEKKQEEQDKKAAAEAEEYNQGAVSNGWTMCKNPKGGGEMTCQDYLAQKGATKGLPNGSTSKDPSKTVRMLSSTDQPGGKGPGDSGSGDDELTPSEVTGDIFSGDTGGSTSNPLGGSQGKPPAVNPDTGVSGVVVPVPPEAYAATIQYSPLFLAGAPTANIGTTLPVTEATINQIQEQVTGPGKSGDSLFDNRARNLPNKDVDRKKGTTFFGIP